MEQRIKALSTILKVREDTYTKMTAEIFGFLPKSTEQGIKDFLTTLNIDPNSVVLRDVMISETQDFLIFAVDTVRTVIAEGGEVDVYNNFTIQLPVNISLQTDSAQVFSHLSKSNVEYANSYVDSDDIQDDTINSDTTTRVLH